MEGKLINYFLLSKGSLSSELLSVAISLTQIEKENIKALNINWNDSTSEIRKNIENNIQSAKDNKIIFLTESFGDTSTNYIIPYIEKGKIDVVTGTNLEMIITILKEDGKLKFEKILYRIKEKGIKSIKVINNTNEKELKTYTRIILMGIGSLPMKFYETLNISIDEEFSQKPHILTIFPQKEIFEIEDKLKELILPDTKERFLILVDKIFSNNLYFMLKKIVKDTNSTVISGINFPMVTYAVKNIDTMDKNFLEKILTRGKRNIKVISELL